MKMNFFKITRMLVYAFTVCNLVLFSSAQAEIYKWVDEHGNTQYSDEFSHPSKSKKILLEKVNQLNQVEETKKPALEALYQKTEAGIKERKEEKQVEAIRQKAKQVEKANQAFLCFKTHKQLAILELKRPIKVDTHGNFFPSWMQKSHQENLVNFVEDKERPDIIQTQRDHLNDVCTTKEMNTANQRVATLYWFLQNRCAKAFEEDLTLQSNIVQDIRALLKNIKNEKTNNLKQDDINEAMVQSLYAKVDNFCGPFSRPPHL